MGRSILYIVTLVLFCFSCGNYSGKNIDKHNITIASLNGPSSMALIKLIDSLGSGTNNNIKVEILDEPVQVRKMMIEGRAGFALIPTTMAAILYNKGLDYRLVAIPVWGNLYLFGNDTTITSWEDLRGKKFYLMARGMTPDVLFRYLLKRNGIIPDKDVMLDYGFPTHLELANAIAAGKVDLGVISEPMGSVVMNRNKNVHAILDLNSEWNKQLGVPLTQTALLVKGSLLSSNQDLVRQIIAACERSLNWVNSNPDSAATLMVRYNLLPDYKTALDAIPRSNMHFIKATDISTGIEEYLNVFFEMNPDIIGGKMPDENFIY
jgi:NitT/TauT family transport system substrate-binding protein